MTRLLLHPDRIGCSPEQFDVRRYEVPDVDGTAAGKRVVFASLGMRGVVTVFPDLRNGSITVVGLKEEIRWPSVAASIRNASCR
jgi:hypothetical protein